MSLYDPMKNVVPPSETARQNEYAALVRTVLTTTRAMVLMESIEKPPVFNRVESEEWRVEL